MAKLFVSTKDESVRMFKNDFLELFSKVHFVTPLIVFIPVILFCLYRTIQMAELTYLQCCLYFIFGFFIWTFIEYFMHRFIFHYHPKSKLGRRIHFVVHGVHHDYPNDSKRLVLPPSLSIPLALFFFMIFKLVFPEALFFILFSGFITGYLVYDMMHYAIHHVKWDNAYWRQVQEHHLRHHFKDPDRGYGVSSDLWDRILNSNFQKNSKKAR